MDRRQLFSKVKRVESLRAAGMTEDEIEELVGWQEED